LNLNLNRFPPPTPINQLEDVLEKWFKIPAAVLKAKGGQTPY
jgi:hypothetical protein